MAKARTSYVCRSCGGVQARWMGKCPDCGTWDALEKVVSQAVAAAAGDGDLVSAAWTPLAGDSTSTDEHGGPGFDEVHGIDDDRDSRALPLTEVSLADVARLPTGIAELDRVLGGGLVPGSVVLLGGDPGIGKSTLLLQAMAGLARGPRGRRILYSSSEESSRQVRLRAERLFESLDEGLRESATEAIADASSATAFSDTGSSGARTSSTGSSGPADDGQADAAGLATLSERLFVLSATNLARIVEQTRRVRPAVLVVDSLQMVFRPGIEAGPGSVTQLRRCCIELVNLAKRTGTVVLIVGHVTKDGQLAGPRLVEHLVDVVLGFEGDRHHSYRLVRAVKNRFGDTMEIGLFEMTGSGLREIADPGSSVDPKTPAGPGSVICPTLHGTRCLLAEIQALTATGILGAARRKASGIDPSRLAMLVAVLEKHGGLRLADQDIFVAAGGGLRIVEPAADLALALAIAGVHFGRSLGPGVAVVGEVALSGQIRPVGQLAQRVREAQRRGLTTVVIPRTGAESVQIDGGIVRVDRLGEALQLLG